MTITTLMALLLRIAALVFAAQLLLNVIGTHLYELQDAKRQRNINRHPHARRLRMRPLLSVVIVARNDERHLMHCLQSLLRSAYRNYQIIIVNNASTDQTGHLARAFKSDNPERNISIFTKRVAKNRFAAAADGFRAYGNGDIVMVIDADVAVDKRALSLAVTRFNSNERLQLLKPAVRTASSFSSLGVLHKYLELAQSRSHKWNSVFGSDYATVANFVCRRQVLRSTRQLRTFKSQYANDVIVYKSAPESINASFASLQHDIAERVVDLFASRKIRFSFRSMHDVFVGWVRLPLAIFSGLTAMVVPFIIGYITFVAVYLHQPIYLLSAAAATSLLILFAIWDDNQLRRKQKLLYSMGIPLVYGPLAALTIIQATTILTTSIYPKSIES